MERRFNAVFSAAMHRKKTQTTDDASPAAVWSLPASKTGRPRGNQATGGSQTSIEDTGTWTADELIGATVFVLAGPNARDAGSPAALRRPRFAIIEDNSADALLELVDPETGSAFPEAFSDQTLYLVEPAGLYTGEKDRVQVKVRFSGGSSPSCSLTLWRYDADADDWFKGATVDNITDGQVVEFVGYKNCECCLQVTNVAGAPTATEIFASAEERNA